MGIDVGNIVSMLAKIKEQTNSSSNASSTTPAANANANASAKDDNAVSVSISQKAKKLSRLKSTAQSSEKQKVEKVEAGRGERVSSSSSEHRTQIGASVDRQESAGRLLSKLKEFSSGSLWMGQESRVGLNPKAAEGREGPSFTNFVRGIASRVNEGPPSTSGAARKDVAAEGEAQVEKGPSGSGAGKEASDISSAGQEAAVKTSDGATTPSGAAPKDGAVEKEGQKQEQTVAGEKKGADFTDFVKGIASMVKEGGGSPLEGLAKAFERKETAQPENGSEKSPSAPPEESAGGQPAAGAGYADALHEMAQKEFFDGAGLGVLTEKTDPSHENGESANTAAQKIVEEKQQESPSVDAGLLSKMKETAEKLAEKTDKTADMIAEKAEKAIVEIANDAEDSIEKAAEAAEKVAEKAEEKIEDAAAKAAEAAKKAAEAAEESAQKAAEKAEKDTGVPAAVAARKAVIQDRIEDEKIAKDLLKELKEVAKDLRKVESKQIEKEDESQTEKVELRQKSYQALEIFGPFYSGISDRLDGSRSPEADFQNDTVQSIGRMKGVIHMNTERSPVAIENGPVLHSGDKDFSIAEKDSPYRAFFDTKKGISAYRSLAEIVG